MKKILKRTLPILLAFTLLFGSCITSHAYDVDLAELRKLINAEQYNLYTYQTVISDGSNYVYYTSSSPIEGYIRYYSPAGDYQYIYLKCYGDFAVYEIPTTLDSCSRVLYGSNGCSNKISEKFGSFDFNESEAITAFQSRMVASNHDIIGTISVGSKPTNKKSSIN